MNRAILFSKFIKYEVLDELVRSSLLITNNTPIDIYIDIQSLYKHVLSDNLLVNDIKVISINILNMAAHYRHYFKSRYNIDTTVYIINNLSNDKQNNIFEQLNSKNQDMFQIIKKIVPYFPLVYYIEKNIYNSTSIILNLIKTQSIPKNHTAFVISTDIYSYQIPAFIPLSILLRPSLNPKFITNNNVIDTMYPRKSTKLITSDLNPALLPVIMAYHKCPDLGLVMINNFKKTITIIRNKIINNQILNGYNSPNIFKKESEEIFKRICLCDLIVITKLYESSYEALIQNWTISKQCDYNTLANILDKLFNRDIDNLLNYLYLLEVDQKFVDLNK